MQPIIISTNDPILAWATVALAAFTAVLVVATAAVAWVAKMIEGVAFDTRTAQAVLDCRRAIDQAVAKKSRQDSINRAKKPTIFSNGYIIDEASGVIEFVYAILNEYEYLCAGANIDVYNPKIIKQIRGNALVKTFYDYRFFLQKQREKVDPDAWSEASQFIETHCWEEWRKLDPDLEEWRKLDPEKTRNPHSGT